MQQPKKPRWKKWLLTAALTLGIGGGAMVGGIIPPAQDGAFGPGTPENSVLLNGGQGANTGFAINFDTLKEFNIVATPQSTSTQAADPAVQETLNLSLQAAARIGDLDYVRFLVKQGADIKAGDNAALTAAKEGRDLNLGGAQARYGDVIKFLQNETDSTGASFKPSTPGL